MTDLSAIRRLAPNFRPVGEGMIAPGLLYRSGELTRLDGAAWEAMAALGIRTLIDLRGLQEIERMPVTPPAGMRLVSVPLQPGDDRRLAAASDTMSAAEMIGQAYRHIVTEQRAEIGRFIRLLAELETLPAVLFCTAGKDRTGILSALVLAALDLEAVKIEADYALTNAMLTGEARQQVWDVSAKLATFGMPSGPIVDALMAADAAYLRAALEAAGPIADYFKALGLEPEIRDRLRDRLRLDR